MDLRKLLQTTVSRNASDLHLSVGKPPVIRVNGKLSSLDEEEVLTSEHTESLFKNITDEEAKKVLESTGSADFAVSFSEKARFRVSVFRQSGEFGFVFRKIPSDIPSFEELGLPENIRELTNSPRGLILITGPTGSGKSTTLASMIDSINTRKSVHIITIEDPVEYRHHHKRALVTQREIGKDVPTFAAALRSALRQDPDVILVGEMRDLETMEAAITAAETGHLVFATLHTTGAARTVDRIIDSFPDGRQEQVRIQLSSTLIAVISQQLLSRIDGAGRIAAFEIMVATPSIRNLIRENKTFRIDSDIQTGARFGMKSLDASLFELFENGIVSEEEVTAKAVNREELSVKLRSFRRNTGRF